MFFFLFSRGMFTGIFLSSPGYSPGTSWYDMYDFRYPVNITYTIMNYSLVPIAHGLDWWHPPSWLIFSGTESGPKTTSQLGCELLQQKMAATTTTTTTFFKVGPRSPVVSWTPITPLIGGFNASYPCFFGHWHGATCHSIYNDSGRSGALSTMLLSASDMFNDVSCMKLVNWKLWSHGICIYSYVYGFYIYIYIYIHRYIHPPGY